MPDGIYLRLFDRKTGELIPTPAEVEQARLTEVSLRKQEEDLRRQAELEVVRLRAELEARRGKLYP